MAEVVEAGNEGMTGVYATDDNSAIFWCFPPF